MPHRKKTLIFDNRVSNKSVIREITYIGSILGHGDNMGLFGTTLVYLITNSFNGKVNLFVPMSDQAHGLLHIDYGPNVRIKSTYNVDSIRSLLLSAYKIGKVKNSLTIFNFFPTSLGKGRLKNFIWGLVPIYLRLLRIRVLVIFHNSVSTSDWKALGYTKLTDRIGVLVFGRVERLIFKLTHSVFLLRTYKDMIYQKFGLNVSVAEFKYLDSIVAFLFSDYANSKFIKIEHTRIIKTIHIHGHFGPQKDIEFALSVLNEMANEGIKFRLLITGSINPHFPGFKEKLDLLLKKHASIIDEVIIPIPETLIFDSFQKTDILLLPYKAAGGRSAVMDLGAFFDLNVVVFEHIEFAEQATWYKNIYLVKPQDLKRKLIYLLAQSNERKVIDVDSKIRDSLNVMENLLKAYIPNIPNI